MDVSSPYLLLGDEDLPDPRDGLSTRTEGAVAVVVLNRPQVLNALDLAMWRRLAAVFEELGARPDVRVVVIRGAGARAFSAGADIAEFAEQRVGIERARGYNGAVARALEAVRDAGPPVVAMIGGLAVGGGCEIAAVADLRICSSDSRFGIPVNRLGVTLGMAEASAVVALVGPSQAKRLVFTGDLLDADEALRLGLVDRVVPREDLVGETWQLVQAIAKAAPTAARANKLAINMVAHGSAPAAQQALERLTAAVYDGRDLLEGIDAFLHKRPPLFSGELDG